MSISENKSKFCSLLKTKNREAFDELYAEYGSQLYGMALQCVGEEKLANELMLITFTNIWRELESFDNTKIEMKTWCTMMLVKSFRHCFSSTDRFRRNENQITDNTEIDSFI